MGKESKSRRGRRQDRNSAPAAKQPANPLSPESPSVSPATSVAPNDWAITLSISQYETFFRIARASFSQLGKVQEREMVWPAGTHPDPDSMRKSSYEQRQRFAAVAVIFSALTLESFINHYGSQLDTDLFDALDRSNAAKWQLFPLLRCGKKLKPGTTAMNGIVSLFRIRDRLVHDKPHKSTIGPQLDPKDFKVQPIDQATKMDPIKHVRDALEALRELDPSIEIDWAFEKVEPDWNFLL
ncbi:hypothetical protein [Nannocystis bainbridge]|uniref:RiboL-PSP-HEPN domain-containing protein n=1 Tax=Nannocystis bainbridge TaxID=2995303 RepID=A0ABT5DR55_9BACT|nr:hypothetical protein [Nannocystis bainbridge]MDC0716140.1 hypothetical protein [Nannocystis bainbridge]